MQKWIDFKNEIYKCSRILQDLKIFFQDSRKYSPKGLLVTLFPVVAKKSNQVDCFDNFFFLSWQ